MANEDLCVQCVLDVRFMQTLEFRRIPHAVQFQNFPIKTDKEQ